MRKTQRGFFVKLLFRLFHFLWSLWSRPGDRPSGWKRHQPERHGRTRRKPEWVRRSIIRLAALMPHAGCRTLALVFNRQHADRSMSVSKTWVAGVLREHAYEIAEERRKIRRRRAHAGPPNRVWGIDLTGGGPMRTATCTPFSAFSIMGPDGCFHCMPSSTKVRGRCWGICFWRLDNTASLLPFGRTMSEFLPRAFLPVFCA